MFLLIQCEQLDECKDILAKLKDTLYTSKIHSFCFINSMLYSLCYI